MEEFLGLLLGLGITLGFGCFVLLIAFCIWLVAQR